MHRMIYLSVVRAPFDAEGLRRLLASAGAHNANQGVTGVLLYDGAVFLQLLEGPLAGVVRVYERIGRDERHAHRLLLHSQEAIGPRLCPAWPSALYVLPGRSADGVAGASTVDGDELRYQLMTRRGDPAADLLASVLSVRPVVPDVPRGLGLERRVG